MPQASEQHDEHKVGVRSKLSAAIAPEGDVEVTPAATRKARYASDAKTR